MIDIRIAQYIKNPKQLNSSTIERFRQLLRKYPYFQTVRMLLLQNLFQEKSPLFHKELGRSAALLMDRKALFDLIERDRYQMEMTPEDNTLMSVSEGGDRTMLLIDKFLKDMPDEPTSDSQSAGKGIPADASVDYLGYLDHQEREGVPSQLETTATASQRTSKIVLQEREEYAVPDEEEVPQEEYFTETLAHIYIQQKKYEQALKIIRALNASNSKKNSYFADQIRFLEKIIAINK